MPPRRAAKHLSLHNGWESWEPPLRLGPVMLKRFSAEASRAWCPRTGGRAGGPPQLLPPVLIAPNTPLAGLLLQSSGAPGAAADPHAQIAARGTCSIIGNERHMLALDHGVSLASVVGDHQLQVNLRPVR